jgi:DNA-binding LacI/PurR family transcriptional regulator
VLVNRRRDRDDDPWIGPDDFQTGWLGASHLLALGHRRIAFLMLDLDLGNNLLRYAGIMAALEEYGCDRDRCWIKTDLADRTNGKQYMKELLALPPGKRPTAIFAPQTLLTDAVVHAIYEAGMKMPADISAVGYTGRDEPDITSVRVPLAEIGRLAAEHLLNLLGPEKETARLPDRPVGVTLVDMGTTGPPPEAVARAVSDPHEKAC